MSERDKSLLYAREYADILRSRVPGRVRQVILYGSQARGEGGAGSDYDVLVVVDERTPEIREAALDAGVEMLNQHEVLFAALIYDEQKWQQAQEFPLGWNIKQEGIPV